MGKLNLYFYTLRCKQIHIGEFILGIFKVFYLDYALIYKSIDNNIRRDPVVKHDTDIDIPFATALDNYYRMAQGPSEWRRARGKGKGVRWSDGSRHPTGGIVNCEAVPAWRWCAGSDGRLDAGTARNGKSIRRFDKGELW